MPLGDMIRKISAVKGYSPCCGNEPYTAKICTLRERFISTCRLCALRIEDVDKELVRVTWNLAVAIKIRTK